MTMPDRSSTVRQFYAAHPEYFTAERHDENRRRSLPSLIAHLEHVHPSDRGRWGVLVKTDKGNKVPCDVIVWKDTGDHVDIMDSQGGIWGPHGPISVNGGDAWFWAPASVVDPTGEERALQGPPYADAGGGNEGGEDGDGGQAPPIDLTPVLAKLDAQAGELAALRGLVQQLLDRPAPTVTLPPIEFPPYEGDVAIRYLPTGHVTLRPKVG